MMVPIQLANVGAMNHYPTRCFGLSYVAAAVMEGMLKCLVVVLGTCY